MKRLIVSLATIATIGLPSQANSASLFQASLEGTQVVPSTDSVAKGSAKFELDVTETELNYFIQLEDLDLVENPLERTNPDDVTAVHIHTGESGTNGIHVLNVFGMPSEDDSELVVDFEAETLTGTWNDSDAIDPITNLPFVENPGSTKPVTDFTERLFSEELYVQVHTNAMPDGAIRGQIQATSEMASATSTPEPSVIFGMVLVLGLNIFLRKRNNRKYSKV